VRRGPNRFALEPAGGHGVLFVSATPWASIELGGRKLPEDADRAGVEVRVRAGTYELVATYQGQRKRERVTVRAGERETRRYAFNAP
jgi:hypothetical protein